MNKGIFTLMAAALLVSGSVITPAFAEAEFATYSTVNSEKALANGVKSYLQKSDASGYYTVKEVTLKDKTKVWTLDETTDKAAVFEVSNYAKVDNSKYVYALNGKLGLGSKEQAMVFTLGTEVPTSNESIDNATSSIIVTGNAGSVTIQGAQGETAYVRNLLGMPLAETVVTSDNATIVVPAGIVLVTVGEETMKVVVK